MHDNKVGITIVVDAHPRFRCESVLWAICAKHYLPGPKRVYAIGGLPEGLERFLRGCDIEVRHSTPLMSHSPHCNKLIPFLDPQGFRHQIVTDSDVFATGDFTRFFRYDQIRLPPNNHGNPPLEVFARIFAAAGLPHPPEPGVSIFPGAQRKMETFSGNVSAGVICMPSDLRHFSEAWSAQAAWFGDRLDLLGRYKGHVDQISFAVAAARAGIPFSHFPPQANAVLQLLPHIKSLYALHLTSGHIPKYPDWFASDGTLRADQIKNPDLVAPITVFNTQVREARRVIDTIPELQGFAGNFLNPAYRRNRPAHK